ncbi:cystathionine beta-lyase [Aspergillus sclerotioniger CBS 115572]|uniref:Cystathionine beta-lyase n=1 Tax=Aspergillus sclerotioniger CBS 115572 TaxID=1450535 RepID=A0A317W969_9EURO|nr:cystathionine beta-lyase [Aspergillus sclerotioniger CBS 115572]PWY83156.1 cystathionine beta-lyase [Aspergillus sclerotioniger CBS 115572]
MAAAETLAEALPTMALATKSIHADDCFSAHRAIAPAMHVAVTYRYARSPNNLIPLENKDPNAPFDSHVYARYDAPNSSRFETVLQQHLGGGILTYATGLAAFHAIMVLLNPKRVFLADGYHGVHAIIEVMNKLTGVQKLTLDQLDEHLRPGDIIHIETPLNPTGEARDLAYYSAKAHAAGAYLTVDSTLAPPPLQDPLHFGADVVLHSGTKYIGGHSDMMCGILVVHPDRVAQGWLDTLYSERMVLGSVMGSLEGWLGLRSLRTLELRVKRQSSTAEKLVAWLDAELQSSESAVGRVISHVRHASLQKEDAAWLQKQMPGGYGPRLPSKMVIFQHATSLGDVESLIEWRAMSDSRCDPCLLRVSCGLEDVEDLKGDVRRACEALV